MNLKLKILFPIIILIAISTIISTLISFSSARKTVFRLSEEQLFEKTDFTRIRISDRIDQLSSETLKLAELKDVQKGTRYKGLRSKVNDIFSEYLSDKKIFESISLTDESGLVVASSSEQYLEKLDLSKSAYFQDSFKGSL